MLVGSQYVLATTDGGAHWRKLSPDLGYPKGVTPPAESLATGRPGGPPAPRGGSIEALAASTVRPGLIWVGTTNGLVKVTKDEGKTWRRFSLQIYGLEPVGHGRDKRFPPRCRQAYVAVNGRVYSDYAPLFYRTRDAGRTWTKIVAGLPQDQPSGSFAQVIRADTKKAGLLFAGTASGMFVSFDDGDHWQSLQLNLPNTSFRDAVITGNDLVVGTYGRGSGSWMTSLRSGRWHRMSPRRPRISSSPATRCACAATSTRTPISLRKSRTP